MASYLSYGKRPAWLFLILLAIAAASGCGTSSPNATILPTTPPSATFPQFNHVVLVVEENHNYSDVIGNSSMPYLNSLALQYGSATKFYANTHPSIGNYLMMTTGQIITNDDSFSGTVSVDNVVRQLVASGKTYKTYAESLPSVGYTGGDSYPYSKHHNPMAYISDVTGSATQAKNLVPFSQFGADLAANQLPNFSFVVPNLLDDAHDGTLSAADVWLQQNMGPLLANSTFQADGLLIVVFDEALQSDTTNGGGRVAAVLVSAKAKRGFSSTTTYQHQSLLRLVMHGLNVLTYPGAAATAPEMSEFFQ